MRRTARMEYLPDEKGEIRNRDFFGGDLPGVLEKLDYLKSMGGETLYFHQLSYFRGHWEKLNQLR